MDYSASIDAGMAAEAAARAIPDDLERWWGTRIERHADGFTIRFNNSHAQFRFEPSENPLAFSWACTDAHMIVEDVPDAAEWVGTRLVWTVEPRGDGSRVTLTHEGLGPQIDCFDVCRRGWQHYFETSLAAHLNGQPASPSLT